MLLCSLQPQDIITDAFVVTFLCNFVLSPPSGVYSSICEYMSCCRQKHDYGMRNKEQCEGKGMLLLLHSLIPCFAVYTNTYTCNYCCIPSSPHPLCCCTYILHLFLYFSFNILLLTFSRIHGNVHVPHEAFH